MAVQRQFVVAAAHRVTFPKSGWLTTRVTAPVNGRVLLEVRGHSGRSSWTEALITVPEHALCPAEDFWSECGLVDRVYRIEETTDKRGQRLLRFYYHQGDAEFVLFSVPGFVVRSACEGEVIVLAKASGSSRTGRNGDRWSLVAAEIGAIVAYEGYYRDDPVYVRVTESGIVSVGETEAVLPPSEW